MSEIIQREISLVLGTAGHIDHGKTTLVRKITGVDCDRLIEEKKRGITIELGFAPLALDDGRVVSIVDVPGHERFIRQMVAGASGIDAVLLVVAADEGVMPQTREHLSILQLLGVRRGIVVLTKSDAVDHDFLALAQDDVRELLNQTFLASAPIIPVSSVTGENIDALKEAIKKLVDEVRPRPRKGALFLPIDRAFAVSGFGTVITGTAYRGTIHPNDEIEIFPSLQKGRVRTVQVHGKAVDEGWAGQRIAASISGVSVDALERGDVVCAGGVYRTTKIFSASVDVLPSTRDGIKHWQRVHLLIGTSDVLARISLVEQNSAESGTSCVAQVFTEENIVCTYGQKFILRFYSPLSTVAGGTVIAPYALRVRRKDGGMRLFSLAQAKAVDERLAIILDERGILSIPEAASLLQEKELGEKLLSTFMIIDNLLISESKFENLKGEVLAIIKTFHTERPSDAGIPVDELARSSCFVKLKLNIRFVRALCGILCERGFIATVGTDRSNSDMRETLVCLADFVPEGGEREDLRKSPLIELCRKREFQPPLIEEAQNALKLGSKEMKILLDGMKNSGEIAIVSGLILHREVESKLLEILRGINGGITLALVRDATLSSRKYILPILEYFDAKGITRRVGEIRIFRN